MLSRSSADDMLRGDLVVLFFVVEALPAMPPRLKGTWLSVSFVRVSTGRDCLKASVSQSIVIQDGFVVCWKVVLRPTVASLST